MNVIRGVQVRGLTIHADERGLLGALEEADDLPFHLARVFFMKVDDPQVERGGHANSCDEFIVTLAGSVDIELDNGFEQTCVCMRRHDTGLWVQSGVLIRLLKFRPGTILLVGASARYEETRHFAKPQPHLIAAMQYA